MSKIIDSFQGDYRFLSNFWPAEVSYRDVVYPSVENAYQAAKCDLIIREYRTCTPAQAKRLSRSMPVRLNWDHFKYGVMANLVDQKFLNHPELKQKLLDTGDAILIEGNTWGDTYWGVCGGIGKNNLGNILMGIRAWIRLDMV